MRKAVLTIEDLKFAHSIAKAVASDAVAIEEFIFEETQSVQDRDLALSLDTDVSLTSQMPPICQRRLALERSWLTGTMSCKLQTLRLPAAGPVAPPRAHRPITLSARKSSLSTCPSSKWNAVSVERPFIPMPQCVWLAMMYIASRVSSPLSCVLPRTKVFSRRNVTVRRLTSRSSRQASQSKS